ncbi:MAG: hypothetical protein AUI85_07075 [Acidobacteriales bacterium 13_1_40CM_3_55_5]|nr:MAG: hypothetical protein AUI85_07075 [Acidobacteriales bacterium 13_1_40CM_3_55_5]
MPVQSVQSYEFCGRSFGIAKIARPVVAVHGSNHRLLVGKHLAYAIRVYNFNVSQMAQHFQNAPLVWRGLVAQSLVGQSRYGCCDLLGTFFRGFEVLFQFGFVHDVLT